MACCVFVASARPSYSAAQHSAATRRLSVVAPAALLLMQSMTLPRDNIVFKNCLFVGKQFLKTLLLLSSDIDWAGSKASSNVFKSPIVS